MSHPTPRTLRLAENRRPHDAPEVVSAADLERPYRPEALAPAVTWMRHADRWRRTERIQEREEQVRFDLPPLRDHWVDWGALPLSIKAVWVAIWTGICGWCGFLCWVAVQGLRALGAL